MSRVDSNAAGKLRTRKSKENLAQETKARKLERKPGTALVKASDHTPRALAKAETHQDYIARLARDSRVIPWKEDTKHPVHIPAPPILVLVSEEEANNRNVEHLERTYGSYLLKGDSVDRMARLASAEHLTTNYISNFLFRNVDLMEVRPETVNDNFNYVKERLDKVLGFFGDLVESKPDTYQGSLDLLDSLIEKSAGLSDARAKVIHSQLFSILNKSIRDAYPEEPKDGYISVCVPAVGPQEFACWHGKSAFDQIDDDPELNENQKAHRKVKTMVRHSATRSLSDTQVRRTNPKLRNFRFFYETHQEVLRIFLGAIKQFMLLRAKNINQNLARIGLDHDRNDPIFKSTFGGVPASVVSGAVSHESFFDKRADVRSYFNRSNLAVVQEFHRAFLRNLAPSKQAQETEYMIKVDKFGIFYNELASILNEYCLGNSRSADDSSNATDLVLAQGSEVKLSDLILPEKELAVQVKKLSKKKAKDLLDKITRLIQSNLGEHFAVISSVAKLNEFTSIMTQSGKVTLGGAGEGTCLNSLMSRYTNFVYNNDNEAIVNILTIIKRILSAKS